MKILACDTSNRACSSALWTDGGLLDEKFINNGLTHSQTFMPLVHDLMAENNMKYDDLDALACTVGPGSFTGIRIGVSAVKTMAMAAEKPAVPVSSLRAMAFPLRAEKALVVPMIDCRNHRAWAGGFYQEEEVVPEMAEDIDEILSRCAAWRDANLPGTKIILIGNGTKVVSTAGATENDAAEGAPALEGFEIREGFEEIHSEFVAAIAEKILLDVKNAAGEKTAAAGTDEATGEKASGSWAELFTAEALMPVYRAKTQAERMAAEQGKEVEQVPIRYYSTQDDEK
ncbi:MAG: tRNA (adenosine(37)-N6)-threonylcarbamoyltransferase complex dimerization subunit type 1 TsaB [Clostridiales bacterium]|nr:tRNA (adenosine(37)-N6)-threonylcarbamoyltransferase complex dimerization subunit type 1 TsaB [Clostridiales bacterium]